MKFRHRTVAGGLASADAGAGSLFPSGFFQIDARIGHAWFARPDGAKVAERSQETLPVLRRAELALASQGRAIARRARRVPAEAIVSLGATLGSARRDPAEPPAAMASVANDNVAYLGPRTRTFLREAALLLMFGVTLAGTYYLGRLHGGGNVIVVPDASTRANKLV